MLWLTSDGYVDQNNQFRRKIGTKGLLNILTEIAELPILKQEKIIRTKLNEYMQGVEQRDDITVIGIKI